jgi:hypothetical protein
MFNEYFAGWKAERNSYGASFPPLLEDFCRQTGLGEVLCAFDDHPGGSRENRGLPDCGRTRYDR